MPVEEAGTAPPPIVTPFTVATNVHDLTLCEVHDSVAIVPFGTVTGPFDPLIFASMKLVAASAGSGNTQSMNNPQPAIIIVSKKALVFGLDIGPLIRFFG